MLSSLALSAGCPTRFTGNPTFSGGPRACYTRCLTENMRMASFVYMGEFATGCVCELDPARAGSASASTTSSGGEGIAAVAGVYQQMLDDDAR